MTRIAFIRWTDSALYAGPFDPNDINGPCSNVSAGLLVHENKETVSIALDKCIDTGQVRSVLCIPRFAIQSIDYFQVMS